MPQPLTLLGKLHKPTARDDLWRAVHRNDFWRTCLEPAFPISVSLLLAFVTGLYLRQWLRFRMTLPRLVPFARVAAFLTGVLLLWLAVASPLAGLDHRLLSVHMIQHLLLMAVAAPLILLGAPATLLLNTLPGSSFRGVAGRFLDGACKRCTGSILSHSIFFWLAGTLVVIGWHVPALFALAFHSIWWHEIELLTFFLAGLLFWWPVIQSWLGASQGPSWSVPLYLFLATLPCDALSAYLVFCDHVVYRPYLSGHISAGVSALQDQQWAGALMWVAVTFIYAVPAVWVTFQLLSPGSRSAPVFDPPVNHSAEAD